MPTLTELTTPTTAAEVETVVYTAIANKGQQTTSWKPGAIARTIISALGIIASAFSSLQQNITLGGFLKLATGDWLTVKARNDYDTERIVSQFATGNLTLDNSGGGVYAVAIGDSIASNPTSGKTYRNTASFTLAALETGKVVPYQAIEAGADSTSAATAISVLETPLIGVSVTNPIAFVGQDEESDPALQDRAGAKLGSLSSNGPGDAYDFVAKSAQTTGGQPAGVTRLTVVPSAGGVNTVYVATATGPITGTIGDPSTPLGAVDEAIQTLVTPLGITATVASAAISTVLVTYEAWVRDTTGRTAAEIETQVGTALAAFMSTQPIGGSKKVAGSGFIFADAIRAAITEVITSEELIDEDLTVPAADIALGSNEAPVSGAIAATINIVSL